MLIDLKVLNVVSPGYAEGLSLKFKEMMSKEVELFLTGRLGVQQTDSIRFLNDACLQKCLLRETAKHIANEVVFLFFVVTFATSACDLVKTSSTMDTWSMKR